MQGGLVNPAGDVSATAVGGSDGGAPSVTGSPVVSGQPGQVMVTGNPAIAATAMGQPGTTQAAGSTAATTATVTGGTDRLLAGTAFTRADVELVLQTVSTLLLLYWIVTEVSDGF